jgi:hypothetical protein
VGLAVLVAWVTVAVNVTFDPASAWLADGDALTLSVVLVATVPDPCPAGVRLKIVPQPVGEQPVPPMDVVP